MSKQDGFEADALVSSELRREILRRRPHWKGRLWVYRTCVNLRGVCTVFSRNHEGYKELYPDDPIGKEAEVMIIDLEYGLEIQQ